MRTDIGKTHNYPTTTTKMGGKEIVNKTCSLEECSRRFTVTMTRKNQRFCCQKCAGIYLRRERLIKAINGNG
jgi:hypothetical protein